MPGLSRELKIVVLGTGGVGKSALSLQFVQSVFVEKYDPTIEDSYRKVVEVPGDWVGGQATSVALEIMDTAGTEQFTAMRDLYMRSGDAFLLVYAVNSLASLDALTPLYEQLGRIHPDAPILLVGNKCDLETEREVSRGTAKQLGERWGVGTMESSARKDLNVTDTFMRLVEVALKEEDLTNGRRGETKKTKKPSKREQIRQHGQDGHKSRKCIIQ
jgi:small GTP-binding protein